MTTQSIRSLKALEAAAVKRVHNQLKALTGKLTTTVLKSYAKDPAQPFNVLWTDTVVQKELDRALALTKSRIFKDLKGTYVAAHNLAAWSLKDELGFQAIKNPPKEYLKELLADVEVYLDAAKSDVETSLRKYYSDGEPGLRKAMNDSVRRLSVRVRASNSVAVTTAYNDARRATFQKKAESGIEVRKRWAVRSDNPCPACAALDGTVIELDEEFDYSASTDAEYSVPKVHGGLLNPPRHPNCRCEIEIDAGPYGENIFQVLAEKTPVTYKFIKTKDIVDMSDEEYAQLAKFFASTLRALRRTRKGNS